MSRVMKASAALILLGLSLAAAASPPVFLTQEEIAAARTRAETLPWAKEIRDSLVATADGLIGKHLDIPRAGGQWPHWYSCADDGARLEAKSPHEHVCTLCGKVYTGSPYDEVYVTSVHNKWLRGVESLGYAYSLDPNPKYAQRARNVLLNYASFYDTLPLHDVNGKQSSAKAKLFSQTLEEAVALCSICVGYSLVRDDPCFTAEDHAKIASGLLRPMCAIIQANDRGISNWQTWHNAGVGCAGYVLGDQSLIDWALNGKSGLNFQLENSILPTGLWYEESVGYHWYSLRALVYLLEASARAGNDFYTKPAVKKLFDAPIRQLRPDLTFPAIHDSDSSSILDQRDLYEIAFRRFNDPTYATFLQQRDSPRALFVGAETLPAPAPLNLGSSSGEGEGLAVLRDPTGQTVLYLDYGPGKAGHNHPAKLGLILWAQGAERLVDPGKLPYGNPMHKEWFLQTVAHNTVVVNETSHARTSGQLKAFAAGDDYVLVRAICDSAYPDSPVTLDRTVFMRNGLIIDIFRCATPENSTFDLPLHFRGQIAGLPSTEAVEKISEAIGYRAMKNIRRVTEPLAGFEVATGSDSKIALHIFDKNSVYTAEGPSATPGEVIPLVLRRQTGSSAVFVTTYDVNPSVDRKLEIDIGEPVTARFADALLTVGADTQLQIAGNQILLQP